MKKLIAALAIAALAAGCQWSQTQSTPGTKNFKYGTGDGETMATAVEIRTHSDTEGGILIKQWIRSNYPGFVIHAQELIEARDHAYNMITIISPDNTSHQVYFDISKYYRRIGNPDFPKPST